MPGLIHFAGCLKIGVSIVVGLDGIKNREYITVPLKSGRTRHGAVAQMGERDIRIVEVRGSIPLSSTRLKYYPPNDLGGFFVPGISDIKFYSDGVAKSRKIYLTRVY